MFGKGVTMPPQTPEARILMNELFDRSTDAWNDAFEEQRSGLHQPVVTPCGLSIERFGGTMILAGEYERGDDLPATLTIRFNQGQRDRPIVAERWVTDDSRTHLSTWLPEQHAEAAAKLLDILYDEEMLAHFDG
jgi:hypothetical protein